MGLHAHPLLGRHSIRFLPLALPTLAALTPEQFEIQLIDECVEPIDFDTPCDVVALTAFNVQSHRALPSCTPLKPGQVNRLGWTVRHQLS